MAWFRRPPVWLLVGSTALLTAVFILGIDRGIARLQVVATPTLAAPDPALVTVVVETPEPNLEPTPLPVDDQEQLLRQLGLQATQQASGMFLLKAERQVDLALEALLVNDTARADRELVAAKTSLDEAYRLAPEELKPQIDNERFAIGRIRADLVINPHNLDEELRRMRDRLLALIAPRPQE
jgi:hypothetical protein